MRIRLFAGAALAVMMAGPALAQPAWADGDWTGFYVGADVGAAFTTDRVRETFSSFTPPQTGHADLSAVEPIGGGIVGYNWEFPNHVVLGFEGDIEGSGVHRTSHCLIQDSGAGNFNPGACFPQSYQIATTPAGRLRPAADLAMRWVRRCFT